MNMSIQRYRFIILCYIFSSLISLILANETPIEPCETIKCMLPSQVEETVNHIRINTYHPPVNTKEPQWDFIEKSSFKTPVWEIILPCVYLPKTNDHQHLKGYRGFNIGVGYSSKTYFQPVRTKHFNSFWSWGTVALIIPYIGFGSDYYFNKHVFLGWGTFYLIPIPQFGFHF